MSVPLGQESLTQNVKDQKSTVDFLADTLIIIIFYLIERDRNNINYNHKIDINKGPYQFIS